MHHGNELLPKLQGKASTFASRSKSMSVGQTEQPKTLQPLIKYKQSLQPTDYQKLQNEI